MFKVNLSRYTSPMDPMGSQAYKFQAQNLKIIPFFHQTSTIFFKIIFVRVTLHHTDSQEMPNVLSRSGWKGPQGEVGP